MKQALQPLPDALGRLMAIRGVSFEWDREAFPEIPFPPGRQVGVIGQEVAKVLPEVVEADAEGYLSVQYASLIPLLIEAIKEQQGQLEAQETRLEQLQVELATVHARL